MTPTLAFSVVQFTMPSKVAVAACTFTADAVTSTVALAWIWICPPALNVITQPLACIKVTWLPPSSSKACGRCGWRG